MRTLFDGIVQANNETRRRVERDNEAAYRQQEFAARMAIQAQESQQRMALAAQERDMRAQDREAARQMQIENARQQQALARENRMAELEFRKQERKDYLDQTYALKQKEDMSQAGFSEGQETEYNTFLQKNNALKREAAKVGLEKDRAAVDAVRQKLALEKQAAADFTAAASAWGTPGTGASNPGTSSPGASSPGASSQGKGAAPAENPFVARQQAALDYVTRFPTPQADPRYAQAMSVATAAKRAGQVTPADVQGYLEQTETLYKQGVDLQQLQQKQEQTKQKLRQDEEGADVNKLSFQNVGAMADSSGLTVQGVTPNGTVRAIRVPPEKLIVRTGFAPAGEKATELKLPGQEALAQTLGQEGMRRLQIARASGMDASGLLADTAVIAGDELAKQLKRVGFSEGAAGLKSMETAVGLLGSDPAKAQAAMTKAIEEMKKSNNPYERAFGEKADVTVRSALSKAIAKGMDGRFGNFANVLDPDHVGVAMKNPAARLELWQAQLNTHGLNPSDMTEDDQEEFSALHAMANGTAVGGMSLGSFAARGAPRGKDILGDAGTAAGLLEMLKTHDGKLTTYDMKKTLEYTETAMSTLAAASQDPNIPTETWVQSMRGLTRAINNAPGLSGAVGQQLLTETRKGLTAQMLDYTDKSEGAPPENLRVAYFNLGGSVEELSALTELRTDPWAQALTPAGPSTLMLGPLTPAIAPFIAGARTALGKKNTYLTSGEKERIAELGKSAGQSYNTQR